MTISRKLFSHAWSCGLPNRRDWKSAGFVSCLLVSVLATCLGAASTADASGDWTVGVKTRATDRVELAKIDHAPWDALLKKYVDEKGRVDYQAWKKSAADTRALNAYLNSLSRGRLASSDKRSKLAFWINAYNAVTIRGILREFPTTSIRNHTAKLWGYNIWKNLQLVVGDKSFSLEDIEHRQLRPMGDARIHFAIVCASIGCPSLRNQAYTADGLDQQLNDNAKRFFADRSKFRYEADRTAYVSPILNWFEEDFGDGDAAVLKSIAKFVPAETQQLWKSGKSPLRIRYLDYDWKLNGRQ